MKKYKVGDLVKIRSNLKCWKDYGCDTVVDDMMCYLGMSARIDGFADGTGKEYSIDIDNHHWAWTPEMFE